MMQMLRRKWLTMNVMCPRSLMMLTHIMTHTWVSPMIPTRLSLAAQA